MTRLEKANARRARRSSPHTRCEPTAKVFSEVVMVEGKNGAKYARTVKQKTGRTQKGMELVEQWNAEQERKRKGWFGE